MLAGYAPCSDMKGTRRNKHQSDDSDDKDKIVHLDDYSIVYHMLTFNRCKVAINSSLTAINVTGFW